jgi:hypothetical protein
MNFDPNKFKDKLIEELKNSDVVDDIVSEFRDNEQLRMAIFREYFLAKFDADNIEELTEKLSEMTQDERNAFSDVRIGNYTQRIKDQMASAAFAHKVGYMLSTSVLVALAAAVSAAASGLTASGD